MRSRASARERARELALVRNEAVLCGAYAPGGPRAPMGCSPGRENAPQPKESVAPLVR